MTQRSRPLPAPVPSLLPAPRRRRSCAGRAALWPLVVVALALAAVGAWLALRGRSGDAPELGDGAAAAASAPALATAESSAPGSRAAERRQEAAAPAVAAPTGRPELDERYRRTLAGITGRILHADRSPAVGMAVEAYLVDMVPFVPSLETLWREPRVPAIRAGSTSSGIDGRFVLTGLESRKMHFLALGARTGRATFRVVDWSPPPGETIDLGDILLNDTATVSGTVVDDQGSPVAGARVRVADFPGIAFQFGLAALDPQGGVLVREAGRTFVVPFPAWLADLEKDVPLPEATTDGQGEFRLEGIAPGKPSLWLQKTGLMPLVHGPVAADAARERKVGRLTMRSGETANGRVVDSAGQGIAGIEVMAGAIPMGKFPVTLLRRIGSTDGAGRFTITCVGRDKLNVAVRRPGEGVWITAGPFDPSDDILIQIEDGGALRVTTHDDKGQIMVPGDLRLMARDPFSLLAGFADPGPRPRREAQADGTVRLLGVRPGSYRLLARADGFAPAGVEVEVKPGVEGTAEVVLARAAETHIDVVEDATAQPVALARVAVRCDVFGPRNRVLEGGMPYHLGTTDASGRLVVRELPAGTHPVHVTHPQFGSVRAQVTVPGPATVVRMPVPGEIDGRLVKKGGGVPDEVMLVVLAGANWETRNPESEIPTFTWSAADGTFRFRAAAPGRYNVEAMPRISSATSAGEFVKFAQEDGFEDVGRGQVTVVAGQRAEMTIELEPRGGSGPQASLSGHVTVNGAPAVDWQITVSGRRGRRGSTDQGGRFAFDALPAKTNLWVNVSPPRGDDERGWRQAAARHVTLEPGENPPLRFDLATGHVRGRVVDGDSGQPLAEASVNMQRHGNRDGDSAYFHATTDGSGRFELRDVTVGTYELSADKDKMALASVPTVTVRAGEDAGTVELRMCRGVKLSGRIVSEVEIKSAEWAGLWFEGRPGPGGSKPKSHWEQIDVSKMDFTCQSLAPGLYRVHLNANVRPMPEPIDIEVRESRSDIELRFKVAEPRPAPRSGK